MWSTRRPRGRVLVGYPDPRNLPRSTPVPHTTLIGLSLLLKRGALPSCLPGRSARRPFRALSVLLLFPDDLRVRRFASPFSPLFFLPRLCHLRSPLPPPALIRPSRSATSTPRIRFLSPRSRLRLPSPVPGPSLPLCSVCSARHKPPIVDFGLPHHPTCVAAPCRVGPTSGRLFPSMPTWGISELGCPMLCGCRWPLPRSGRPSQTYHSASSLHRVLHAAAGHRTCFVYPWICFWVSFRTGLALWPR